MAVSRSGAAINVGARVVSADGKQLGVVKETRVDRFLVDVRWSPDYWLGTETVDNVEDELVQLILTKDSIGPAKLRHEVEGPGLGKEADYRGPAPQNRPPPTL